jgi:hypothetical protein
MWPGDGSTDHAAGRDQATASEKRPAQQRAAAEVMRTGLDQGAAFLIRCPP